MSTSVIDEVIKKMKQFSEEDRDKLMEVLQEQKNKKCQNGKKGYVSQNTIWVRENSQKYRGLHVALKDGELIATGKTIKEADLNAKKKGVKNSLLHYIPAEDEEVWGGW